MNDYIWLIGSRGVSAMAQMILVLIFAASASQTAFGTSMAVFAAASVVASLADFGLATLALRAYSNNDKKTAYGAIGVSTKLSVGVAAVVLVAGLAFSWLSPDIVYSLPLVLWALAERNTETRNLPLIVDDKSARVAFIIGGRRLAAIPAMMLAQMYLEPAISFSLALASTSTIGWIVSWYYSKGMTVSTNRVETICLLKNSRPFAIAAVSSQLRNLDTTIVSVALSSSGAAVYGLGVRIASPFLIVYNGVANVVLAKSGRSNATRMRKRAFYTSILTVFFAIIGLLVVPTFLPVLKRIIPWLEVKDLEVISLIVSAHVFIGLSVLLGSTLTSLYRERSMAIVGVSSGILSLTSMFVTGVLSNSLWAVALVALMANVIKAFILLYLIYRNR